MVGEEAAEAGAVEFGTVCVGPYWLLSSSVVLGVHALERYMEVHGF